MAISASTDLAGLGSTLGAASRWVVLAGFYKPFATVDTRYPSDSSASGAPATNHIAWVMLLLLLAVAVVFVSRKGVNR